MGHHARTPPPDIHRTMNSIRFAVRSLLKSPGFTLTALITLALGIGVNTSMFSLVDELLFRIAPFPGGEHIHQILLIIGDQHLQPHIRPPCPWPLRA